jgi:hypothetical protein
LTKTGDLSACKSKRALIQLLTVNKPVAEARPPAPVIVALSASSAAEAHPAPAAAGTLPEAGVAAPQQELAAAVVQPEAEVAAPPQGPALVGSSQATAVEIPDDDAPPPGWGQWGSLPAPAPKPQAGALVRRWDGHMVAGGSRHGAEASSSHAGPLARAIQRRAQGRGKSTPLRHPPSSPTPKRSSCCGRSCAVLALRSTGR